MLFANARVTNIYRLALRDWDELAKRHQIAGNVLIYLYSEWMDVRMARLWLDVRVNLKGTHHTNKASKGALNQCFIMVELCDLSAAMSKFLVKEIWCSASSIVELFECVWSLACVWSCHLRDWSSYPSVPTE